ncbi:MAG TPA: hypothetical protein VNH11_14900, partial [Pirellulales bacterium]|nr:hypothetical protein [Pirellulales bacterium]
MPATPHRLDPGARGDFLGREPGSVDFNGSHQIEFDRQDERRRLSSLAFGPIIRGAEMVDGN